MPNASLRIPGSLIEYAVILFRKQNKCKYGDPSQSALGPARLSRAASMHAASSAYDGTHHDRCGGDRVLSRLNTLFSKLLYHLFLSYFFQLHIRQLGGELHQAPRALGNGAPNDVRRRTNGMQSSAAAVSNLGQSAVAADIK